MKKGWCPTLTKPMESGDGWLVRLNMASDKLSAPTARAIAQLSAHYGNGQIDLTSRGNLQIRGVAKEQYETLLLALTSLGLTDEARPPRQPAPDHLPELGYIAIGERLDTLSRCARGAQLPSPACGRGVGRGRFAPSICIKPSANGYSDDILALGLPFGRMTSEQLTWLADHAADGIIHLSPWRTVYLHGVADTLLAEAKAQGFITQSDDARRRIEACPGSPACSSAQGDTRALAMAVADAFPQLQRTMHISGCAKGCACARKTDIAIVAQDGTYTLAFDATAGSAPLYAELSKDAVLERLLTSPSPFQGEGRGGGYFPHKVTANPHPNPPPERGREYLRSGNAIYEKSFAIIRAESDLSRFTADEEKVAVRLIHACGMVELAKDIVFSPGMVTLARKALQNGAPILCDANMIASGITRSRLPAKNDIICTLSDPRVAELAKAMGNTRSAAAMELWRERMGGALVVIGNAPTSLFRLLEMLDEGAAPAAAVIGMPVGFVGAAESKEALMQDGRVPFAVVKGRKGGSAMAVAAVNAIAQEAEL